MRPAYYRVALCLIFSSALTRHCAAQSDEPGACSQLQQAVVQLDAKTALEKPSAKRQSLLHFLNAHIDDPQDCVTTSTYTKLLNVERSMVRLDIGQEPMALAEWFLQCNSIATSSQRCKGPLADDIPVLDDQRLLPNFVAPFPKGPVRIVIDPGMSCQVLTVSVIGSEFAQNGRSPLVIAHGPGPFSSAALRSTKSPILMATLRCKDNLRFRKAAWLFTK